MRVVLDTNVVISGLRSRRGASHRVLRLIGGEKFRIVISIPLLLEYEGVAKRQSRKLGLTHSDIDDILDYLCKVADRSEIFYLWRPFLRDPNDDMVLEAAVAGGTDLIVTHNVRDFAGVEQFGVSVATPQDFLRLIGESS